MTECTKVKYSSLKRAETALKTIKKCSNRKTNYPVRSYLCEFCGFYHLTSTYERDEGMRKVDLIHREEFKKLIDNS